MLARYILLTHDVFSFSRQIALKDIVWEESKLHEQPNEYVDSLIDFSVLLWKYLQTSQNKLPDGIIRSVWDGMVGGCYMTFLEGFSKVSLCSTEGRALMSMDVAAYSSGVSPRSLSEKFASDLKVTIPSNGQPYRNATYVDTYIKMFYFPHKVSRGRVTARLCHGISMVAQTVFICDLA
jgi:hypothetical protein